MYVVFGDEIVDSEELREEIQENSDFIIEKDLTKGTKREDTLAYQMSIDIEVLNEIIKEEYSLDEIDSEELFDEYITLADELAMELEDIMPEYAVVNARAYKWDNSANAIKVVIAIGHAEIGELKVSDVVRRLLSQVD